jgi:uncharacterized membrane protein (UPF0127 family)
MLFDMGKNGQYPFWMKDMNFPIDIVWLDNDFKVVEIGENIDPSTYPSTIGGNTVSRYVLEIPGDKSIEYGIENGSILVIAEK